MNSKPPAPTKTKFRYSTREHVCILAGLIVIGLTSGWFSGTSAASITSTLIPIFVGLIGLFLLSKRFAPTWGLAAVIVFCISFVIGIDNGENIKYTRTVNQLLRETDTSVSGAAYDEISLIAAQLSTSGLSAIERDQILYGVVLRIVQHTEMSSEEKVKSLREFSKRLQSI